MRSVMIPLMTAIMVAGAVPAMALDHNDRDGRYDRQYASRGEVERSRARVEDERRDYYQAQRYGDRRDVKEERRELERAQREYRKDAKDFNRYRSQRQDARYWNQGQYYNYNRPDPRYNGYYADNYYRGGNYQAQRLNVNDRIYRGQDNRYYCRRSDGTTGLLVGAIGGGVLGNVIAPGGSKTLGSIIGGSLGAVLGQSVDRNNVTCR
jgi:hypothetical protein